MSSLGLRAIPVLLSLTQGVAVQAAPVSIGLSALLNLNTDLTKRHEGVPVGVPSSYDWYARPRIHAGNSPGGFSALTGWGHVFWRDGANDDGLGVQIRSFITLLCHGHTRKWTLIQRGKIAGAQFKANYAENFATRPLKFENLDGVATVTFKRGTAFHFWPACGRSELPAGPTCGVVALVEARLLVPEASAGKKNKDSPYLIGLGADYWKDRSVQWDHYRTNKSVAVGRLRGLAGSWTWYGISTAEDSDLVRLYKLGFGLPTTPEFSGRAACAAALTAAPPNTR